MFLYSMEEMETDMAGPTITEFFAKFPTDDACLDYLMAQRHGEAIDCPKCGKHGKFHRIRRHPAYECAWCGFEIFPMVGTIFHRSHVPLQKWFYAIYLFTTTRHGVPAKELQRQLGVSYPTAFRMSHKIRELMAKADGDSPLSGMTEVDETYVGGKPRHRTEKGKWKWREEKVAVFGMIERGGDVITRVVPNAQRKTLLPIIAKHVARGSTVNSDEFHAYKALPGMGYTHQVVKHRAREYVRGTAHTNTLDSFWSRLKNSIRGTHVHVSRKYLPSYLGEFEFRHNLRQTPDQMFARLLASL